MDFHEQLQAAIQTNHSTLCIGLDPDPRRLPTGFSPDAAGVLAFNRALIAATSDLACAYKPNSAFYEAMGAAGWETLRHTIAAVPGHIPVILDAKRGDIGSTAQAYARAAFEELKAHAITLNPYLGAEALEPFLQYPERGCFILCRTSNPGGAELQDARLADGTPLFMHVARLARELASRHSSVGLVVGATAPDALAAVHALAPELPLLVPGIGAQGGDLERVVRSAGRKALVSVSRSIQNAATGHDWQEQARAAALGVQRQLAALLSL